MVFFRVDDATYGDARARAAGLEAIGLWTLCGTWSAQQGSDGHIPAWVVPMCGGTPKLARRLVDAGLWSTVPGGWQFVDWSPTNYLAADVRAYRDGQRDRKRRERAAKKTAGTAAGAAGDVPADVTRDIPTDVPGDVPQRSDRTSGEMSAGRLGTGFQPPKATNTKPRHPADVPRDVHRDTAIGGHEFAGGANGYCAVPGCGRSEPLHTGWPPNPSPPAAPRPRTPRQRPQGKRRTP